MPGPSSRTMIEIAALVSEDLMVIDPDFGLKSNALFTIFPIACSSNIFSALIRDLLLISRTIFKPLSEIFFDRLCLSSFLRCAQWATHDNPSQVYKGHQNHSGTWPSR